MIGYLKHYFLHTTENVSCLTEQSTV